MATTFKRIPSHGSNGSSADVRILEAAVGPDARMNKTAARFFARLELAPDQREEITRLLDKNNTGTITPEERSLLESYARIGNFLNLLRAKAHATLLRKPAKQ